MDHNGTNPVDADARATSASDPRDQRPNRFVQPAVAERYLSDRLRIQGRRDGRNAIDCRQSEVYERSDDAWCAGYCWGGPYIRHPTLSVVCDGDWPVCHGFKVGCRRHDEHAAEGAGADHLKVPSSACWAIVRARKSTPANR